VAGLLTGVERTRIHRSKEQAVASVNALVARFDEPEPAREAVPMRLIEVTEQVDYPWGGLSYSIPRLCSALIGRGHDVTLACLTDHPDRDRPAYVRAFYPQSMVQGTRIQLGWSRAMRDWLEDEARSGRLGAIHAHGLWRLTSVFPCNVGARRGVPVVLSPRGSLAPEAMQVFALKKRLFWRLAQGPALRRVTCFHATAESEAEQIRQLGFTQPIALIPNGVDIPKQVRKERSGTRTLLYLGRVHRIKGLDVLLRAWAAIEPQRGDWQLRIVGPDDGGCLPELQALANSLGLQRVRFIKPADGEERLLEYVQASIYVLPSRSENFGMTVAEALSAGTPVIVSKGAPWPGLDRERCGWWVDCELQTLTEALRRATCLPHDDLDEMGARGRQWMEREFGWGAIAAKMEALYDWLASGMPDSEKPAFLLS
jgi:glycosyltransferase involved in cell wall biosynthesis